MLRSRHAIVAGLVASLVCHGLAAVALWGLPTAPGSAPPASSLAVEVLDGGGGGSSRAPTAAPAVVPGGARSLQNVDAPRTGGGGDRRGASDVILLVERAEAIALQDSPRTASEAAQVQRIRTASDRATAEPRRATPHPADEPFLASGDGEHRERRAPARADARAGARAAPPAAPRGSDEERATASRPAESDADAAAEDPRALGAPEPSPGEGIVGGTGASERAAARVAHARPPVDRGPAATPARRRSWQVRDDQDSELLATSPAQSWASASPRTGPDPGEGRGGTRREGPPGAGDMRAEGGHARAHGPGHGPHPALDTRSDRYRTWFLGVRRSVHRHLRFPRERMLRMDQGTSVYRVVVTAEGKLAEVPELLRSSRFEDLDAAARRAIERGAPFGSVPSEILGAGERYAFTLPIDFSNPMVR
ncbi:MAG: TonB family protein [Myxococcota bacterium]